MLTRVLANLKISIKIMLIAGLAFIGFLTTFVAAVVTDNLKSRADTMQQSAMSEYIAVRTIAEDFLNARRREKDFLLRRDMKHVESHGQITAKVETEITDLLARIDPQDREDLVKLEGIYQDYNARFKAVAESTIAMGLTPETGLLGGLRTAVHAIEGELKSHDDAQLTISMLLMRRSEKDFLARGDQKYADALAKELTHFNDLLKQSIIAPADQDKLQQLATAYGAAFQDLVGLQLALAGKLQGMSEAYSAGEPLMDKIRDASQGRYDASEAEMRAISQQAHYWMLGSLLGSAVVVLSLAWIIGQCISRPIARITDAMERLGAGDKTVTVAVVGKDEVARMGTAFATFRENMIESDRLREEQEEIKRSAEASQKKMLADLADRFETSVGQVVASVISASRQLQGTAQGLSASAEEASQQAAAVTSASEEMTQSVQSVASATEELSTSIAEISQRIVESSRIVDSAVSQAGDTNAKVQALSESAQRIGDVVRLISDIAGQTNLLALNATIEAARAGEAGKGFAVVASEVKALANQTAKATEEIGDQVRAIQEATGQSADAIGNITTTVNKVSEISTSIASAVEEQSAATQEISRNVQTTAESATEVSSNIQGVTEASRLTSRSSSEVLSAATELTANGDRLRTEVTEFLRQVRAG